LLRSFGSTFTAHAIGGALWIWTVPMTANAWILLIPIVIIERTIFALGISGSYIIFTNILNALDKNFEVNKYLNIEKRYIINF